MLHLGHGFRFDAEAFDLFGVSVGTAADHLQGDEPVELTMPGTVDNAHTAFTQRVQNIITAHRDLQLVGVFILDASGP
jgi:hypothetical protein